MSSGPTHTSLYLHTVSSQTKEYDLWSIQIGDFVVFVATTQEGKVAHHNDGPWIWYTAKQAEKQIAKWR